MEFIKKNEEDCEQDFCLSSPFQMQDFEKFKTNNNIQCPLKKEILGHFSWSILHTFTFAYPEHPKKKDQKLMTNFFESFAHFYPCKVCASHFQGDLRQEPPDVSNRKNLVLWLCRTHNKVKKNLIVIMKNLNNDGQKIKIVNQKVINQKNY